MIDIRILGSWEQDGVDRLWPLANHIPVAHPHHHANLFTLNYHDNPHYLLSHAKALSPDP